MSTMPLPVIVDHLVRITGCSDELAKAFIVEFSEIISAALVGNGQIEVSGIGLFRSIVGGDGVLSVELVPDQTLAADVNRPFTMFEPVELDDEITEDMLEEAADEAGPEVIQVIDEGHPDEVYETYDTEISNDMASADHTPLKNEDSAGDKEPKENATVENSTACTESVAEVNGPSDNMTGAIPPPIPDEILNEKSASFMDADTGVDVGVSVLPPPPTPVTYACGGEYESVGKRGSRHPLMMILVGLLCLLAGLVIGYFTYEKLNLHGVKSVNISAEEVQVIHSTPEAFVADSMMEVEEVIEVASSDTIWDYSQNDDNMSAGSAVLSEAPVTDSNEIVTDTVRSGRFLTSIALDHYGKKKFWVYIYLENMDKLGDPDLIPVGTVVVVPPAEKYGIRSGDPASEALAEQKAVEIKEQYSKKY